MPILGRRDGRDERERRDAMSGKGGTGEMGGKSIVKGRAQRVTSVFQSSPNLELRTSNRPVPLFSLVSRVPPVSSARLLAMTNRLC